MSDDNSDSRRSCASHPLVAHVIFPRLQSGEFRRRADAYLKGGYGALIGFELKGGVEAGRKFIDALKLFYHVANMAMPARLPFIRRRRRINN
jgi:O-acetylhomoserine/O-acetylserine sulfhydrylase-like pyridoxal-dependent enzyme